MNADKINVLIVDDLPEKILVYRTILESLDINLMTARSGSEALRLVLQYEFAVILLDVNMPGIDGLETAALIRQRKKSAHTPIIFVTAFADEVRTAQGYAYGAVDYILTPVVPDVLRAKVRVFVDLLRMTQQIKRQAEERIALAEERNRRAAAEEANRRLSFLTQAGAVLGQSLEYESCVKDLLRLAVPSIADFAAVVHANQFGGRGGVTTIQIGKDGPVLDESSKRDRLPRDIDIAISQFVAGVPEKPLVDSASEPDHKSTNIILPLKARGRTFAVLALSRNSGATYSSADISLAEALASRAAVALDNASLFREVQQADRQKNEFLSMLAHELRNPLAPIRNAVEVLRMQGQDPAGLEWARDVIDRQVAHLVRLVDDLLDISRITRGKIRLQMRTVEVAEVVNLALEASRPLFESRRHRLEVAVPSEPIWVQGDPARIAQILTNLLNNAAKYTVEGGHVALSVQSHDNDVIFRVRDSGIGIPAEMLSAVFDLFTQVDRSLERSDGGLGIGLTLVRRLVEMHGGSVQAASEGPGKGSEFTFRLAACRPNVRKSNTSTDDRSLSHQEHFRVLVVDDNIDGADTLATLLRLKGHDARLAHDGLTAIEVATKYRPEVVLLDIGLPGLDGFEVARRLRIILSDLTIVAVTGYGREEDRKRSHECGFDHHLVKPIDLKVLEQVLQSRTQLNSTHEVPAYPS